MQDNMDELRGKLTCSDYRRLMFVYSSNFTCEELYKFKVMLGAESFEDLTVAMCRMDETQKKFWLKLFKKEWRDDGVTPSELYLTLSDDIRQQLSLLQDIPTVQDSQFFVHIRQERSNTSSDVSSSLAESARDHTATELVKRSGYLGE
jgi:hypothetical protein